MLISCKDKPNKGKLKRVFMKLSLEVVLQDFPTIFRGYVLKLPAGNKNPQILDAIPTRLRNTNVYSLDNEIYVSHIFSVRQREAPSN